MDHVISFSLWSLDQGSATSYFLLWGPLISYLFPFVSSLWSLLLFLLVLLFIFLFFSSLLFLLTIFKKCKTIFRLQAIQMEPIVCWPRSVVAQWLSEKWLHIVGRDFCVLCAVNGRHYWHFWGWDLGLMNILKYIRQSHPRKKTTYGIWIWITFYNGLHL